MNIYFIFFFVITFNCFGQEVSEINKSLEIPDSLEFEKEIRIYKKHETSHNSEIFRMYDVGNNNWKAEIFYYSDQFKAPTKINKIEFPKENIGTLKPKNAYLIWLNLLLCNVEYLPSQKKIDYKLKAAKIISGDGEYGISQNKKRSLDGESYRVFIKNGMIKNDFSFDNPAFYLEYYPTVDELIGYNELLSIINKDFNFLND